MMKGKIKLLMTVVFICLFAITIFTSCSTESKGLEYELNGDGYSLVGIGTCVDTEIVIPATYRNLPVTRIYRSAFEYYGSNITSITIPESVKYIGDGVLAGCTSLERIVISEANEAYSQEGNCIIEKESRKLVAGCNSSVIPSDVTSIADSAFRGCSKLTSVTIPDSVTNIGKSAFAGCSGLTSITIPFVGDAKDNPHYTHFGYLFGASVPYNVSYDNYINNYVPPLLKTVVVTGGTHIDDEAFAGYSKLTSIELPNSITSIGYDAFQYCAGLTYINLPDSVMQIKSSAFSGCNKLTNINLPKDITYIADFLFYGCENLLSITIPDTVESIGTWAFWGCGKLESITITSNVVSIGENAFSSCWELKNVVFNNFNGWNAESANISESELRNSETAADYLTSVYSTFKWTRK